MKNLVQPGDRDSDCVDHPPNLGQLNRGGNLAGALCDRRGDDASFTIPEWCRHRRISVSMYYKLRAQGRAPATLDVGRHKTITAEADAAWVRERQSASVSGNPITNDEAG
jgi:hypothetical protein